MEEVPASVTREDRFARAMCDRLDYQNELLGKILDRLPDPAERPSTGGTVELREPATPADTSGPVPDAAARPAPARRRTTPAKKASTRTATKKEAT